MGESVGGGVGERAERVSANDSGAIGGFGGGARGVPVMQQQSKRGKSLG